MTNYIRLVSVEVGTFASDVVVAKFSAEIVYSDITAGITIFVNGTPATIISAWRDNDQKTFYYKLSTAVSSGQVVKFRYKTTSANIGKSSQFGDYTSSDFGTIKLEDMFETVINNVPSNDPIGDALRAACVAYWKMDEASGTRLDSTGHGYDVSEVFTTESIPHVPGVVGKVSNAAKIQDSTIDAPFLEKQSISINLSGGWTLSGWIYFPQFDANAGTWFEIVLVSSGNIVIHVGIVEIGQNDISVYNTSTDNQVVVSPGNWHFFSAWRDGNTFYLQIDNGTASTGVAEGIGSTVTRIDIGSLSYVTDVDYILFDELGLYNIVLDSNQSTYLFNSSTGRTLYP